jgi:hypothetical protein
MSDTTDPATDTETTAVPPAQPDTFAALSQLLYVIGNTALFEGRLKELRAAQSAVEKAQRELSRREIAATAEASRQRDELVALEKAARARQLAADTAERKLEDWKQRIAEFQREKDARRYTQLPGGMVQEHADPVYVRPAREADIETVVERVPGYGQAHTLTQSVKRKSMRRGADV